MSTITTTRPHQCNRLFKRTNPVELIPSLLFLEVQCSIGLNILFILGSLHRGKSVSIMYSQQVHLVQPGKFRPKSPWVCLISNCHKCLLTKCRKGSIWWAPRSFRLCEKIGLVQNHFRELKSNTFKAHSGYNVFD
jgi:hypothetical protein